MLKLGGTGVVERGLAYILGQRGLHRMEVCQSQGLLLLLLPGDKVHVSCWLEAGLGLRVHIRRTASTSCLAKILKMVLCWDSLVGFYLHLLSIT